MKHNDLLKSSLPMNLLGAPASRRPVGNQTSEFAGETPALPGTPPRFRASKREFVLGIFTLLTASSALAEPAKLEMPAPETLAPPDYRPWTVSLEAGTVGVGGSVAWRFADHFGARLAVDGIATSDSQLGIKGINYDSKLRLLSEPLTFDLYPWKEHSFHISLGVMFNQNE